MNGILLPEKEDFYSFLNVVDFIDADYTFAKRVCKDFEIKNLGEHYDLYFQSKTLLLEEIFGNFWNMCSKIYKLGPGKFLLAPGLALEVALKETEVTLHQDQM